MLSLCGLAIFGGRAEVAVKQVRAFLWMEVRKVRDLPSDMPESRMAPERVEGVCPVRSVRAAAESAGPTGRKRPLSVR